MELRIIKPKKEYIEGLSNLVNMEEINYGNHGMVFDNNLETSFLCLMNDSKCP